MSLGNRAAHRGFLRSVIVFFATFVIKTIATCIMKRLFGLALCAIFAIVSVISCEKAPVLELTGPGSIHIGKEGASQTITFNVNRDWSASSSETWCKVSPSSGSASDGTVTITVSCDPNTSYDARTCTVTIRANEMSQTVKVTQDTGLGLIVSQKEYNLGNAAQSIEVEVQANVKYNVSIDSDAAKWITNAGTKGLSAEKIVFNIAANDNYDPREGKITISQADGSLSEVVIVRQGQTDGLFITTPNYELSNASHTLSVEVQANVDFEVNPSVSWIKYVETKALKNSTIILSVEANADYDAREGIVSVKQKNGSLSGTITIKQGQNEGLQVTNTSYNLTNQKQTLNVEVKANVAFTVTPSVDWIQYVETKALSTSSIVLSINANETYGPRDGSVTIKQVDGALTETITIKQGQTDGIFLTTPHYDLSNSSHTLSVEVLANVEYTVTPLVDWIQYVQTKALESSVITLSISANEDYDAREGSVEVKQVNGEVSGIISIRQAESYGLFVTKETESISCEAQDVEVEVKYNVDFEFVIPDEEKSMIKLIRYESDGVDTKALSSRRYIFSINENTTYDERSVSITFKQKDGSLSGTFKIIQAQKDAVLVDKTEYNLNWEDHDLDIPVKANVDVEVAFPEEFYWIEKRQESETKGLVENIIKLHVSFNPTYDARVGEVIIKQIGGNLKQTVKVNQSARTWLDADGVYAKAAGGEYKMNVRYNVPYVFDLETLPEWAHYVSKKTLDKNTDEYIIRVDENTGYSERVKEIKIKSEDGTEEIEREIHQDKTITVTTDVNELKVDFKDQRVIVNVLTNVDFEASVYGSSGIFLDGKIHQGKDGVLDKYAVRIWFTKNEGMTREAKLSLNWKDGNDYKNIVIPLTQKAEEYVVETAGTLSSMLDIDNIGNYKNLKISGNLNGDDILTIMRCVNLEAIDLEDANIVSGGGAYYAGQVTHDNILPQQMFKYAVIKTVILPRSILEIEPSVFPDSQLQTITMFEGLETIGSSSFRHCQQLKSLVFPSTLKTIRESAFSLCYALASIEMKNGVEYIGNSAFRYAKELTYVRIPASVKWIDTMAFDGCDKITNVYLEARPETFEYLGGNLFSTTVFQNATLHIKKGLSKSDYWNTAFGNFVNVIADID